MKNRRTFEPIYKAEVAPMIVDQGLTVAGVYGNHRLPATAVRCRAPRLAPVSASTFSCISR